MKALPRRASLEAMRLWEVRNLGHIEKTNRIDHAGERKWFTKWRHVLEMKCGSIQAARRADAWFIGKRMVPGDEIDVIAFSPVH